MFIYNSVANTFIDKKTLNDFEMKYLTKYNLNYIKVKVEELSGVLRDFARYVVELTRPKQPLFARWWFWLIIGLLVVIVAIFGVPILMGMMTQFSAPIKTATETVAKSKIVG